MSAPSEAAEPVSRFLPLTMASALFMDLLDTAALGSALPLAVPVYTRLAAQAGAHMRNDGKVSP